jgi:hypothetical protein
MLKFAFCLAFIPASAFAGATYTVNDITTSVTFSGALSANGKVTGVSAAGSACPTGGYCGVVYTSGSVVGFGTGVYYMSGVNNSGQATGNIDNGSNVNPSTAFRYNGSSITLLSDPILSGGQTQALGIDNAGEVLEYAATNSGGELLLWRLNGTYVDLGTWDGSGAISSTGVVAYGEFTQAFVNTNGVVTSFPNLPGGNNVTPTSVSSNGLITGFDSIGSTRHVFLSTGSGNIQDLGIDPGVANPFFINSSGTIAGSHFLYSAGVWSDLNNLLASPLGFSISNVDGINDSGTILAHGFDSNSVEHTLLLTPTSATPEPATGLLLLSAGAGMYFMKRGGAGTRACRAGTGPCACTDDARETRVSARHGISARATSKGGR